YYAGIPVFLELQEREQEAGGALGSCSASAGCICDARRDSAVFASHILALRACFVAAAITPTAILSGGPAPAAPPPLSLLPPAVVTSTPVSETAAGLPIGTRIITAHDIERSGATTLQDLLRSSAGVRTLDRSGSPNPQIDLRGFGSFGDQNTLVLLDGL